MWPLEAKTRKKKNTTHIFISYPHFTLFLIFDLVVRVGPTGKVLDCLSLTVKLVQVPAGEICVDLSSKGESCNGLCFCSEFIKGQNGAIPYNLAFIAMIKETKSILIFGL